MTIFQYGNNGMRFGKYNFIFWTSRILFTFWYNKKYWRRWMKNYPADDVWLDLKMGPASLCIFKEKMGDV